jgi:hypothetical protein
VAAEEGLELFGISILILGVLAALQLAQPAAGVAFRVEEHG